MADKRFVIALTRTCGSGATWIGESLQSITASIFMTRRS